MLIRFLSGLAVDDIHFDYGSCLIYSDPCLSIFTALWVSETQSSSLNSQQLFRLFQFWILPIPIQPYHLYVGHCAKSHRNSIFPFLLGRRCFVHIDECGRWYSEPFLCRWCFVRMLSICWCRFQWWSWSNPCYTAGRAGSAPFTELDHPEEYRHLSQRRRFGACPRIGSRLAENHWLACHCMIALVF